MNAGQHKIATPALRLEGWLCTALAEDTSLFLSISLWQFINYR